MSTSRLAPRLEKNDRYESNTGHSDPRRFLRGSLAVSDVGTISNDSKDRRDNFVSVYKTPVRGAKKLTGDSSSGASCGPVVLPLRGNKAGSLPEGGGLLPSCGQQRLCHSRGPCMHPPGGGSMSPFGEGTQL